MPDLKTPRILWGALVVSTFLYLVVLYTQRHVSHPPPEPLYPPAFGVTALMVAVISFVLPRQNYRQITARTKLEIVEAPDQSASDIIPYRNAPTRRVFASPSDARRRALMAFQTPFILGMALSEAIALFGFALGFLGHPVAFYLPFFIVTWVLMALRFPTEKAVFGRFEQAMGAKFPS